MAGGRKTKYHTHVEPKLLLIAAWARDGFTEEQTAIKLGLAYSTFRTYKDKYPALSAALKRGQEVADVMVENSLFKRAMGYQFEEVTKERIIDSGQVKRHGGQSELTDKEWQFAIRYFGGKCCYCNERLTEATKDHIVPLVKGGELTALNIIPCCRRCNSSKKAIDLEQWYKNQPFYKEHRLNKINDYVMLVKDTQANSVGDIGELTITKVVTKEVQPDVVAQIFWLKNRRPDRWRDRQDINHSGGLGVQIIDDIGGDLDDSDKD
ncbi:5-methylcytosine-specific restriction endonuclease McrA [Paenibacillus sp. DS2015]|uniref:HNH endonuclease n=1 Tax=Paenibacillus sp. DS2015 TaxID=3373917 RepID=UPI003D1D9C09